MYAFYSLLIFYRNPDGIDDSDSISVFKKGICQVQIVKALSTVIVRRIPVA